MESWETAASASAATSRDGQRSTRYTFDDLSRKFGWDDYEEYDDTRYATDKYDKEFDFLGWHFNFWGDDNGDTPRYGATMSRDGETWECDYDCIRRPGVPYGN